MTEPTYGRRVVTIVVVAIILWTVLEILKPLRMAIAWAAVLAFLLHPLQLRLKKRFRSATTAAGVITALTPVAIIAPLLIIGFAFAEQIAQLVQKLQENPQLWDLAAWQDAAQNPRLARIVAWLREHVSFSPEQLRGTLSESATTMAKSLAAASGQMFLNLAGTLLRFFLMLFILFFTLRDGAMWFERATALLPLDRPTRDALFERLGKVLRAVVYGCGLTAAVQGTLVGIGFAIAGLPSTVVFGVLAGVSALLPFGGAALVWVPGTLYLFSTGSVGWGTFLLVWGALVSLSDNFIRPIIISRYTPVPTLLVFLGVIGGVAAFGVLGFIMGPVILVLAIELLHFAEESAARRNA